MRIPVTVRLVILTILAIAALWWRSQLLTVQRTVIANLPAGTDRLAVTDLDDDGESEVVAYCTPTPLKTNPAIFYLHHLSEAGTWFVRFPLMTNPKVEKLPYSFRLPLPAFLPPLRRLLVEKVTNSSKPNELGWLKVRNGKFVFEPLFPCLNRIHCYLVVAGNLVNISVNLEPRFHDIPAKHFSFRITPDGDWQPVNFVGWKSGRVYWYGMEYFGDFDGDGIVDLLKFSSSWGKMPRFEVYWGDGKRTTTLLESHAHSSEIVVDDLDEDGKWEVVLLGKIWKFSPEQKGFVTSGDLPLKRPTLPTQRSNLPKPSQSSKTAPTPSSLPFILPSPLPPAVLDKIAPVDLDGDGHKELMVFWREPILTDIPPFPIPRVIAVQVLWWDGQNWKVSEFKPPETRISSQPSAVFEINGQRYVIANETYRRIRLRFPIVSLRPLRLQFWETKTITHVAIFRLPKGKKAFDLRLWRKIAELPLTPSLVGDWDGDGKVEMLMRRKFWDNSGFYFNEPKPISETLYLARFDGEKVKLAKLPPPKLLGASSRVSSIAIVKGRKDAAIFALWDRSYESVLERVKWR